MGDWTYRNHHPRAHEREGRGGGANHPQIRLASNLRSAAISSEQQSIPSKSEPASLEEGEGEARKRSRTHGRPVGDCTGKSGSSLGGGCRSPPAPALPRGDGWR